MLWLSDILIAGCVPRSRTQMRDVKRQVDLQCLIPLSLALYFMFLECWYHSWCIQPMRVHCHRALSVVDCTL